MEGREKELLLQERKTCKERSYSVKVRVEELEGLLGPEDVDVDFRRILKEARVERWRKIFETFSSEDLSFLVWLSGRDGTNTKERHGDKIRRHLQVKDGGENPTNALASAKLVISSRSRRPLGLDGRQAKAKGCLRKHGQGNAEIS